MEQLANVGPMAGNRSRQRCSPHGMSDRLERHKSMIHGRQLMGSQRLAPASIERFLRRFADWFDRICQLHENGTKY